MEYEYKLLRQFAGVVAHRMPYTVFVALPALHFHKGTLYVHQWRSQDIADARAQHGHTTFEILREVQKHLGGSGACSLGVQ